MADTDTQADEHTCTECGCSIDWCSGCDEEDCPSSCCYGCMVIALLESTPTVHAHGG